MEPRRRRNKHRGGHSSPRRAPEEARGPQRSPRGAPEEAQGAPEEPQRSPRGAPEDSQLCWEILCSYNLDYDGFQKLIQHWTKHSRAAPNARPREHTQAPTGAATSKEHELSTRRPQRERLNLNAPGGPPKPQRNTNKHQARPSYAPGGAQSTPKGAHTDTQRDHHHQGAGAIYAPGGH